MSQQTAELPVEPKLFLLLETYANALSRGEVNPQDELAPEVVTFCINFFQQFLQSVFGLEITGINDQSKRAAIERRLELGPKMRVSPRARLIVMFEDLCDMWPDIAQGTYVGSEASYRRFHKTYMPRLLQRIEDWATADGYIEIATRATAAARVFNAASSKL